METTITITTINKPTEFLKGLCENINKYGHHDVDIIIIGDIKTPPLNDYCKAVSSQYSIPVEYLNVTDQERVLPKSLLDMFGYNTPDRTILGGMLAYLHGAERIIALDDDNFVTDADFVGYHKLAGQKTRIQVVMSNTGWFNVHEVLDTTEHILFYPRGYPFGQRHIEYRASTNYLTKRVVVNQGLVLGDPDIDAIQRLVQPINAFRMIGGMEPQFGLYKTWSPFNYQNTSLCRELIPCYFRPKSGLRNADIWTAYIFNRLAERMGDIITFGQPLVKQVRNKHNLFDDLEIELQNNKETDYFCDVLMAVSLTENTYFGALNELVSKVKIDNNHPMTKNFFREYDEWLKTMIQIL